MIFELALLASMAGQTCPPGYACPPTSQPSQTSPQWVWVTNQGRYGWGTINASGYFIEAPMPQAPPAVQPQATPEPVAVPTPTPSSLMDPRQPAEPGAGALIGATPNYGVDFRAIRKIEPGTFASNDPSFSPLIQSHVPDAEQQVPIPTRTVKASSPVSLFSVIVVILLLVLLLTIGIYENGKARR